MVFFSDATEFSEKTALANAIRDSVLFPWHKLDALSTFVFTKVHFLMRVGVIRYLDLQKLDRDLKSTIRCVCGLPSSSSSAYIEGPATCGCLGFPSLVMWQHAHAVAQFARSVNDILSPVGELARVGFLRAMQRGSIESAVDALQVSATRARAGRPPFGNNHWTSLLYAIKALNAIMEFKIVARDDMVDVRVGLEGCELHSLPPQFLFRNICLSIHRVTFSHLLASNREFVFRHLSASHVSSYSIKTGWGLDPVEWRFMHRARLDLVSSLASSSGCSFSSVSSLFSGHRVPPSHPGNV